MREYNVDLLDRSDYGGFWKRVGATVVDSLILWLPCTALAIFLGAWLHGDISLDQSPGIGGFATYGGSAIYSVCFWVGRWRATPGKRLVKLIVLAEDGRPLSVGRSVLRVICLAISGLVIVGPLFVIGSERRQALHDMLAGTIVVAAGAAARVKVPPQVAGDEQAIHEAK